MWYIILGVIMVLFAWMQSAYGKLQKHKADARKHWVRVDALLKTRSSDILRLIELAEEHDFSNRELLAEIYDLHGGYARSEDREVISANAEAVTPLLDQLLEESEENQRLADEKEFQELWDELAELEEEIEAQSVNYNNDIKLYNQHRDKPSLRLQVAILGAIPLKGFHIRPTTETS